MSASDDALYRLHFALNDLERATRERNLPVARYLIDTEIASALHEIEQNCVVEREYIAFLRNAVLSVHFQLWKDPS
jgi:hypothetical protein